MAWTELWFGKYKGKALPQVLFSDPDWFFWAMEIGLFNDKGVLLDEAKELNQKAKKIFVPNKGKEKMAVDYYVHPSSNRLSNIKMVPASRSRHKGSSTTIRSDYIDLSIPRSILEHDKSGNNFLISFLKNYLFEDGNCRMTKRRCEEFFSNDDNFDI